MPNFVNQRIVEELTDLLRDQEHWLVVGLRGLRVEDAMSLRTGLHEANAELKLVKNSLASRAFGNLGATDLAALLDGPSAVITGGDEPVAIAKLMVNWSRKDKRVLVRGGLVGGRAVSGEDVRALAALPPRPVLLGQLLGLISQPMSQFVGVLAAGMRDFVGVLTALKDKKEKESEGSGEEA